MPLFRVTKRLADGLKMRLPAGPSAQENAEHEWFADLFFVGRKKAVVWVHRTTLFVFVRPAVVAAELRGFDTLFRSEFRVAIASLNLPESLTERFDVDGAVSYAPTNDRAVVGSMLDYRHLFEGMAESGMRDTRSINAKLNDAPMSMLGMESAVREVRALVGLPR